MKLPFACDSTNFHVKKAARIQCPLTSIMVSNLSQSSKNLKTWRVYAFMLSIMVPLTSGVSIGFALPADTDPAAMVWIPNRADLAKSINSSDFTLYFADVSSWLNSRMPVAASSFTKSRMESLLADPVFANVLAQREFLSRINVGKINEFALTSAENKDFLAWVLSDTAALNLFLQGGSPGSAVAGKSGILHDYVAAITIWAKLFNLDVASRGGLYLKLAIATSLAHSTPLPPLGYDGETNVIIDPVSRYNHFKAAYDNHELFPVFETLPVFELRMVVAAWALDSDLLWARQMIPVMCPNLKASDKISNVGGLVNYNDPVNVLSYIDLVRVGGMCGAISFTGCMACQAYGVPAMLVGQPSHCAFIYRIGPSNYNIGNDIHGWDLSVNEEGPMTYFLLDLDARRYPGDFSMVENLKWFSRSLYTVNNSIEVLAVAKSIQPRNIATWKEVVSVRIKDGQTTGAQWTGMLEGLHYQFSSYPELLNDVIKVMGDAFVLRKVDKVVLTRYAYDVVKKMSDGKHAKEMGSLWGMYRVYSKFIELRLGFLLPSQLTVTGSYLKDSDGGPLVVDGLMEGVWHSKYDSVGPIGTYPYSLIIKADKAYDIDKVVYWPRQDGCANGNITSYNLYVSSDGMKFNKISSGRWAGDDRAKVIQFARVNAQYVKFEALAGVGGFATASEIQIFKYETRLNPALLQGQMPAGLPKLSPLPVPVALPLAAEKPEAPISVDAGVTHYEIETAKKSTGEILDCDSGGKQINIKSDDTLSYTIAASVAGRYGFELRFATPYSGGKLELRDMNKNLLASVDLENSTGLWATTSPVFFNLSQGVQTLNFRFINTKQSALRWFNLVHPSR